MKNDARLAPAPLNDFADVSDLLSACLAELPTADPRGVDHVGDGGSVAVYLTTLSTPIGPVIVGANEDGVCLLEFASSADPRAQLRRLSLQLQCKFVRGTTSAGDLLERELVSYFAGELREFTVPVSLMGSAFQKSVWEALRLIPYGQTRSYGDQAAGLGKLKAVRAVGHANGQNPISVVVPCHRVIGADGRLTGYGGGLWRKQWLLRHEGATFRDPELQTTLAFGDEG